MDSHFMLNSNCSWSLFWWSDHVYHHQLGPTVLRSALIWLYGVTKRTLCSCSLSEEKKRWSSLMFFFFIETASWRKSQRTLILHFGKWTEIIVWLRDHSGDKFMSGCSWEGHMHPVRGNSMLISWRFFRCQPDIV